LPVMNDDQATAVIGGKVVVRSARAPRAINAARFFNRPFLISGSSTSKEAPSRPMTNSFLLIITESVLQDTDLKSMLRQRYEVNDYTWRWAVSSTTGTLRS